MQANFTAMPKRILSLLPAATEIVCLLGLDDQLIGRSHECDYPEHVKHIPVCSSPKFIPGNDSAEIDRQVKQLLADALSVYEINRELIRSLQPDVVITQAQCEVCAVSMKDVEQAFENLLDKEAAIISLHPQTLDDIFDNIRQVAASFDAQTAAEMAIERMHERLDIISHKLKFIDNKPKVACIEWLSPLMTAGNWTPGLVELAGGQPILAQNGTHSSYILIDDLLTQNPDVLVLMPCGFTIPRTLQEVNILLQLPGWNDLAAVKHNRVYVADGNQYFNRPGPRIADSAEILAEILHPKQFVYGYEGDGWVRLNV